MGSVTAAEDAADVPWLDDRQQHAWRAFVGMQTRLSAHLARDLVERAGMSNADFVVLVRLSEHPDGRMRAVELARELDWEKSRLSHQLSRMQQRGLVERRTCDEDRRGAWIAITADGRSAIEAAAPKHVETVRRVVIDVLSEQQLEQLRDISTAILDRLDTECAGMGDCCDGSP